MPNVVQGGFRQVKNQNIKVPVKATVTVASGYATAIFKGDVVKRVASGHAEAAAAGDTNLLGVVIGVSQYWDGQEVRKGNYLPASTTYGSNLSRQSKLEIIRFTPECLFEVDCDDAVTATTLAAYQAFVDENCDLVAGAGGNTTSGLSSMGLDISTHVATAAQFRIVEIPNTEFQDFAAANVKLYVRCNESHLYTTAGV